MSTSAHDTTTVQNLGLFDRVFRFVAGAALLGYAVSEIQVSGTLQLWHGLAMLASIYPLMTGILGWGPFYALFGFKSCNIDGRNQCGSFPYEVMAILNKEPKTCHIKDGRSLGNCR